MAMIGIGHGKLILFGEHAAVYGHPALGVPLDLATIVEVTATADQDWSFPDLSGEDAARLEPVLRAVSPSSVGGRVSVRSTVPRGLGFGSSAALCVGLAAALGKASPPYGREIWECAHRAERFFHGTPSGIDTGLAVLQGMRAFRPRPPGLPQDSRLPDVELSLVVGSVPRARSTARLIAELRERMAAGERQAVESMAELGRLAGEAEGAIRACGPGGGGALSCRLATLADDAQSVLVRLGLSTPELEGALRLARESGALGGKLSGAGGGGAFFLFAPDLGTARDVAAKLRSRSESDGLPTAASIRAVSFLHGVAYGATA